MKRNQLLIWNQTFKASFPQKKHWHTLRHTFLTNPILLKIKVLRCSRETWWWWRDKVFLRWSGSAGVSSHPPSYWYPHILLVLGKTHRNNHLYNQCYPHILQLCHLIKTFFGMEGKNIPWKSLKISVIC